MYNRDKSDEYIRFIYNSRETNENEGGYSMLSSVFQNLVGRESLIAAEDTWALLAIMCLRVAISIYLEQK